jgi:uncharacterized phage-associated protein
MKNGHDPRAIANQLLSLSKEKGIEVSMMKLIKLVFFAHGWMLGVASRPLSSEPAEAWQYGPVFRSLYNSLPYQGAMIITEPIRDAFGVVFNEEFDPNELNLMSKIIDIYGKFGAFQLSDLTHETGSPWHQTIQAQGVFSSIDDDLIKQYFAQKAATNKNKHHG